VLFRDDNGLASAADVWPAPRTEAGMETIYDRPRDYDLEHAGDDEDVGFYVDLVTALRPRRVGDRYESDFDCHVYFPRALELLFRLTGFEVDMRYGGYQRRPFTASSRQLILIGRKRG
jgi:hypothetical protein